MLRTKVDSETLESVMWEAGAPGEPVLSWYMAKALQVLALYLPVSGGL